MPNQVFSTPVTSNNNLNNNTSNSATEKNSKAQFGSKPNQSKQGKSRAWRSAVDPKTGRTYYYDIVTRETQWRKPLELASEEEKIKMAEKEKKQRDFFSAMEANILKNIQYGSLHGKTSISFDGEEERDKLSQLQKEQRKPSFEQGMKGLSVPPQAPRGMEMKAAAGTKPKASLAKPRMVRTISNMDDNVLAELTRVKEKRESPNSVANITNSSTSQAKRNTVNKLKAISMRSARSTSGNLENIEVMYSMGSTISKSSLDYSTSFDGSSSDEEDRKIQGVRIVAEEMSRISLGEGDGPLKNDGSTKSASPGYKKGRSSLQKPVLKKRNTCGTLYVGSTMSAPDKDATIKCICGVFRAHLLQSAREESSRSGPSFGVKFEEYEIFNDIQRNTGLHKSNSADRDDSIFHTIPLPSKQARFERNEHSRSSIEALSLQYVHSAIPTLEEITTFFRDVFNKSQMESDCIIMSLIYVERMIKVTNGGVRPNVNNWRSILFSSMILASKVWDDLSMWNADFSQCVSCPPRVSFSVKRINELELAMLDCFKYSVKVAASEYAKYYFLLRSMLIRSGLGGDDLNSLRPLEIEGAKYFELKSARLQEKTDKTKKCKPARNRRCKSMGDAVVKVKSSATGQDIDECYEGSKPLIPTVRVNLEQLVQM
mmetsp:Transcript_32249/g.47444  ORF Transcript_32249/g.47444 Transcript_32249/m.47444 type:complete len:656 (+) Transcript_32249:166-2133(+)|eukprot:CAMPEP_0195532572 /NCGR_PEP_ID=MMETSP0794_2-20130614/38530_1 /TAXON_ID=515487 /ORGANISM="Stephanopyxis turris, Strain CCMP 815" /LENGTH=655 /DNA_ID=CAMNT_0040664843 /DNA_START=146 /DNA_END=2113 /DNA_ORIENTATION=-